MDEVHARLARIPLFAGLAPGSYAVERLGGLTNRNYRVAVGRDQYVLRIPGDGTSEYIDRKAEEPNARIAAAAGVNVEVLHFDTGDGVQVTRFIDGAATMNADRFRDLGSVARAAHAFRRIHDCGQLFVTDFELFGMMDGYLDLLNRKQAWVPDGYRAVQREAEAVRAALAVHPAARVPCHCDPLAENFLDTGTRMWIVEWEYAGNNDPMWDLGDVSVEAGFGAEQDAALLEAYFGGKPPAHQTGRMVMYKAMSDLLWTLWGAIQHANENPVDDFKAYAVNRFARCQALMGAPEFGRHLEAVKRGCQCSP
jgi:thiamine kinase-like enzyme